MPHSLVTHPALEVPLVFEDLHCSGRDLARCIGLALAEVFAKSGLDRFLLFVEELQQTGQLALTPAIAPRGTFIELRSKFIDDGPQSTARILNRNFHCSLRCVSPN